MPGQISNRTGSSDTVFLYAMTGEEKVGGWTSFHLGRLEVCATAGGRIFTVGSARILTNPALKRAVPWQRERRNVPSHINRLRSTSKLQRYFRSTTAFYISLPLLSRIEPCSPILRDSAMSGFTVIGNPGPKGLSQLVDHAATWVSGFTTLLTCINMLPFLSISWSLLSKERLNVRNWLPRYLSWF